MSRQPNSSGSRILRASVLGPPNAICVVGALGSGKTEACAVLQEQFGYARVSTGEVLSALLGLPLVPTTERRLFQERAWAFVSRPEGRNRFADAILREAHAIPNPRRNRVVIDGIRHVATLESVEARLESRAGVLLIDTPPDHAYRQFTLREGARIQIPDYCGLRNAPAEGDLASLAARADATIYNRHSLKDLQSNVAELMIAAHVGPLAHASQLQR